MSTLPTGTVTLLLADVEGSTRLWEGEPDSMAEAVARLDKVVNEIVETHGGVRPVEQGEGDSFVVAFPRASDAVAAALDLQLVDTTPIRLRIGIHTGEVQLRDEGNYIGPAINRTARIRDLGHGGQTLLSQATHDLVVDRLPDGAGLIERGSHRLKDLARPENVHQLCHAELRAEFPPLRSLDAYPHNLPVQMTSFIGRARELADLQDLLRESRLVTLTGSGGAGKTRLALHLAAEEMTRHPGGVWHVDLAPVTDADLVASSVAQAMGYHDEIGRTAAETVIRHVGDRSVLVILDNCEHLIDTCARLTETLLRSCPSLVVVATSREPLGLAGEVAYRVPSLPVPENGHGDGDAVELFVDRARRARPGFELSDANQDAVVRICRRLDGIPLALELAAARVRAFAVDQIADGLDDRFRLLTGGVRTALPRQHTLRASVDWSYHLLTEPERLLFERLAVFSGSFDFVAAEAVGVGGDLERHHVLDLLGLLVDKSLVLADDVSGAVRYRLLETIRQYGLERLTDGDDLIELRRRHRDHYSSVAAAIPRFSRDDVYERARADLDNFRAAIQWSLDAGDFNEASVLVMQLLNIWSNGHETEGRANFEAVLLHLEDLHPLLQAWTLGNSAFLEIRALSPHAVPRSRACLERARQIGARGADLAMALATAAEARFEVDGVPEWAMLDEAVSVARETGETTALAYALGFVATTHCLFGDPALAEAAIAESSELWQELEAGGLVRIQKVLRGLMALLRGEVVRARALLDDVVAEARSRNERSVLALALTNSGWALALAGLTDLGREQCDEALAMERDLDIRLWEGAGWFASGIVALAAGDADRARQDFSRIDELCIGSWKVMSLVHQALAEVTSGALERARNAAAPAEELLAQQPIPAALGVERHVQALIAIADGDLHRAEQFAHESIEARQRYGDENGVADGLELLATMVGGPTAARLLGAAGGLRDKVGSVRMKVFDSYVTPVLDQLRLSLGTGVFEKAWTEGAALSLEEAVAYARRGRGERKRPSSGWASLTPAERDVVKLVGDGLANKEIAERLFISPRTVQAHLTHIYSKLDCSSRAQLMKEVAARA